MYFEMHFVSHFMECMNCGRELLSFWHQFEAQSVKLLMILEVDEISCLLRNSKDEKN